MSLNLFIVVKYTPHAMSHLKCPLFSHFEGFSSVALDTRCCAAVPTFQSLELSPLPEPRLWSHESTAALPSPSPRSSHLLSESVDLPTVSSTFTWTRPALVLCVWCLSSSGTLQHESQSHSFLRMNNFPPNGWTTFCLSAHLSTDICIISAFGCCERCCCVPTCTGVVANF